MNKIPRIAHVFFAPAAGLLLVAGWLALLPVGKPSWSSEAGTGKGIQMLFCVAPLAMIALAIASVGVIIVIHHRTTPGPRVAPAYDE